VEQQIKRERTDSAQHKRKNRLRKWIVRGLVLLAFIAAGIFLQPRIRHYLSHVSTDDAFVTGTMVPISPEVKGKVAAVYIEDNQAVNAGDALFDIEKDDYAAVVEQSHASVLRLISEENQLQASLKEARETAAKAKADLESAKARLDYALKEKNRYQELSRTHFVPKSKSDQTESQWLMAQADYKAAQASIYKAEAAIQNIEAQVKTQKFRIREAQAALSLAKINLERTRVKAPLTGRVAKKNVDPGKYLQPGQPVLALVAVQDVWVIANYKETDIDKIRVGQPAEVEVDAYPGVTFKGHVESFQAGTGSVFSLLPPENATGNYVKVVQRVPVKIVFDSEPDPLHPLWPGLSVVPYIDIQAKGK
jgi:membrane fusion protein (multidrug efflux system)